MIAQCYMEFEWNEKKYSSEISIFWFWKSIVMQSIKTCDPIGCHISIAIQNDVISQFRFSSQHSFSFDSSLCAQSTQKCTLHTHTHRQTMHSRFSFIMAMAIAIFDVDSFWNFKILYITIYARWSDRHTDRVNGVSISVGIAKILIIYDNIFFRHSFCGMTVSCSFLFISLLL